MGISNKIDLKELIESTIVSGHVQDGKLVLVTRGGAKILAGDITFDPLSVWPVGSVFTTLPNRHPADIVGGGSWSPIIHGAVIHWERVG